MDHVIFTNRARLSQLVGRRWNAEREDVGLNVGRISKIRPAVI